MIRDLGVLGIYQVAKNNRLKLKTPGRKYSSRKDSKTNPPGQFFLQELDPKDARVGDIIDMDDYRKTNSYIVSLDPQKKLILIPLPDEHHAGYGTIPLEVSSFFKNAIDAFGNKMDIEGVHLSPRDQGLKQYFFKGTTVPRKYSYTYRNVDDEVEVMDPESKKTVILSRDGHKLAPYLRAVFKASDETTKPMRVEFIQPPAKQAQLNAAQKDTDNVSQQQFMALKKKLFQQSRKFKEEMEPKITSILTKHHVEPIYGASGGGMFRQWRDYSLRGSKSALEKVKKELLKLNKMSSPNGLIKITM